MLSCLSCCGRRIKKGPGQRGTDFFGGRGRFFFSHVGQAYLENADLTQRRLPHLLVLIGFLELFYRNDLASFLVPRLEHDTVGTAAHTIVTVREAGESSVAGDSHACSAGAHPSPMVPSVS